MPDEQVYLGFDFGTKRLGVAVGQSITMTAKPLTILSNDESDRHYEEIDALVKQWSPSAFIVGMPQAESEQADKRILKVAALAKKFAKTLKKRHKLPTYVVNEHLSSREVHHRIEEGFYQRKHHDAIDDIAAQIILETWMQMDERQRRAIK